MWENAGRPFPDAQDLPDLAKLLDEGTRPPITETAVPEPVADLIKSCWAGNPRKRLTSGML